MKLQGKKIDSVFYTNQNNSFFKIFFDRKNFLSKIGAGVVLSKNDISGISNSNFIFLSYSEPEDNDYERKTEEIIEDLKNYTESNLSVIIQVSILFPPDLVVKILENKNCDGVATRTCLMWNQFPDDVKKVFFRLIESPFGKEVGGYVFGKYILPLSLEWIHQVKRAMSLNRECSNKIIIAGGGILKKSDIKKFFDAKVDAVVFDEATSLRFWNIKRMVRYANKLFF